MLRDFSGIRSVAVAVGFAVVCSGFSFSVESSFASRGRPSVCVCESVCKVDSGGFGPPSQVQAESVRQDPFYVEEPISGVHSGRTD